MVCLPLIWIEYLETIRTIILIVWAFSLMKFKIYTFNFLTTSLRTCVRSIMTFSKMLNSLLVFQSFYTRAFTSLISMISTAFLTTVEPFLIQNCFHYSMILSIFCVWTVVRTFSWNFYLVFSNAHLAPSCVALCAFIRVK